MAYLICIGIGYLLGTFNLAFLLARLKGFDIRTRGSNNPGASNATITMGWKIGILVGACDIAKAAVAVLLARTLFQEVEQAGVIAGVSCVLGHMFPFYLAFRGGKGFASYMGMILVLNWKFFLIIGIEIILITIITDYIALATLTTVVSFPIFMFFSSIGWVIAIIAAVASVFVILKHIQNFRRILKGEEIGLRKTL